MKNLGKVLKSSFLAKMAFVVAVLAVLIASASCKHDKGGDKPKPNPKVEEVTLTFKMGANVTKVEPASVKVEKGKAIKLSELKAKITKMEFAANMSFLSFVSVPRMVQRLRKMGLSNQLQTLMYT